MNTDILFGNGATRVRIVNALSRTPALQLSVKAHVFSARGCRFQRSGAAARGIAPYRAAQIPRGAPPAYDRGTMAQIDPKAAGIDDGLHPRRGLARWHRDRRDHGECSARSCRVPACSGSCPDRATFPHQHMDRTLQCRAGLRFTAWQGLRWPRPDKVTSWNFPACRIPAITRPAATTEFARQDHVVGPQGVIHA